MASLLPVSVIVVQSALSQSGCLYENRGRLQRLASRAAVDCLPASLAKFQPVVWHGSTQTVLPAAALHLPPTVVLVDGKTKRLRVLYLRIATLELAYLLYGVPRKLKSVHR